MKSSEYHRHSLEREQRDIEACEVHVLQRRADAQALREDPGIRAYARQVADELAALVELYAHPDAQLTLADALDETLAEEIVSLALRHRHALLSQPVSGPGYSLLKHKVWEACGVFEHFLPAKSCR